MVVEAQPLWRIRLRREMPRYALYALSLWGVLASARFAIAPPRPAIPRAPRVEVPDRGAEQFASLFARRYLTWNASQPQAYQESLAPFLGEGLTEGAGVQLPGGGSQSVEWVEVAQERRGVLGERIYTIACQTTSAGLLYLTVAVSRDRAGALALAGYPAFVGPPASSGAADLIEGLRDVESSSLAAVVERALRNYLDDSPSELAADLTESARVSLPAAPLSLSAIQQLKWLPGGGSVFAVLQASDRNGTRYTLAYELDVAQVAGRWEISAIQMNPYT